MMTDIITAVAKRLTGYGIESGRANAEEMLGDILGCGRADIYLGDDLLTEEQIGELEDMIARRIAGEPLQYILGSTGFFGSDLLLENGVFIPRPETELVVESVIDIVHERSITKPRILDLCTGSGNIPIALTKILCDCRIVATDISDKAIDLAQKNAAAHDLQDRIDFTKGDLFEAPGISKEPFDIIVSNPPYISTDDIGCLPADVKMEPVEALDGGIDGMDFYRRIIKTAPSFLKRPGFIVMELADGIAGDLKRQFEASGYFAQVEILKDLNLKDRIVVAERV